MSEKEHISATVDSDVKAYLSQDSINTSGLINKLVKKHMNGADSSEEMLKLRKSQLESQVKQLKSQQESVVEELELVNSELETLQSEKEDRYQEALDALEHVPWKESNPAIQKQADEVGMSPETLIEELEDYYAE